MILDVHRGILGGTFDPPHLAHLVAGETAYRDLTLDIVTFVPTGAPWQKESRDVTPAVHRWEMVLRAIAGVDYFEADDREIRRTGWTYTIDTLNTFPSDEHITLIMGADTAAGLPTWERFEPVLERADIAVYPRSGTTREAVESALAGVDHVWLDAAELDIEATVLREHARAEGSLRFLVRDAVWRYIQDHHVYGV
jgi:nicotinate-nucleotide adenylyltransferase